MAHLAARVSGAKKRVGKFAENAAACREKLYRMYATSERRLQVR